MTKSPKAVAARMRNWEILQLRGLHAATRRLHHLDETARNIVHNAIDKRLEELGAETEKERYLDRYAEDNHG